MTLLLDRPEPVLDDATRRQFVDGVFALGLLAACADDGTDKVTATPSPATQAVTIEHAAGSTRLDGIPQRVVVLNDALLGDVAALAVVPVGIAADPEAGHSSRSGVRASSSPSPTSS